jgi:hypothetical protein
MSMLSDRPHDRADYGRGFPDGTAPSDNGSSSVPHSFERHRRATGLYAETLKPELSARDVSILHDLARVRCLNGKQLERLHFSDLALKSHGSTRRRILNRLIRIGAVATLDRRIGGLRAGSDGQVYTLDAAGQRFIRLLDEDEQKPARRPWEVSTLFLRHTLGVAELYVQLREAERAGHAELTRFLAEPACWQRTATLGTLKPDAYLLIASGQVEDAWWCEIDRGTEGRTALRRKLQHYLLAAQAGVTGPDELLPGILICVPDDRRLDSVTEIIQGLPPPTAMLFHVTTARLAVAYLLGVLRE